MNDPVAQALADAKAIAATPNLPVPAHTHVLPSLCRIALENAFLEAAWIRHHRRGGPERNCTPQSTTPRSSGRSRRSPSSVTSGGSATSTGRCAPVTGHRWHTSSGSARAAHTGGVQNADALRFVEDIAALAQKVRKPEVDAR